MKTVLKDRVGNNDVFRTLEFNPRSFCRGFEDSLRNSGNSEARAEAKKVNHFFLFGGECPIPAITVLTPANPEKGFSFSDFIKKAE